VAAAGSTYSHFPTWATDEYWGPGANATSAQVQQYASYAQGGLGNDKAVLDCPGSSCKSVFYVDPNFLYANASCPATAAADVLSAATEGWYIHEAGYTDAAHRVHGSMSTTCNGVSETVPVYVLNDFSTLVQTYFRSYLRANADAWNYYFMDDTSGEILTQMYGPGGGFCQNNPPNHYCTTTQELPTDATVVYAHSVFANAMTHASGAPMDFFYNGLTTSDGQPTDLTVLDGSSHFSGVVCEDCIVNGGTLRPTMYAPVLTSMAYVDGTTAGQFVELNHGSSPAGSAAQVTQRMVTTAIAWLGYKAGHTIVFPSLEDNSESLAVWPEDNVVPSSPVQSMVNSATDIQTSTAGVYRREFSSCTNAGVSIGPCAALINSTSSAVTVLSSWLHNTYGHVITTSGGDLISGGTLLLTSTVFTPNVTTIPASQALLLSR
jgi:hypothetical protein